MTLKIISLPAVALSCYALFSGAGSFPYDQAWKKVDSLIQKKGLPKSALEEVNKIYAAAKKEKAEGQWVKAVIYMQGLQEMDEENVSGSVLRLEKEIQSAPPRVAALLKSLEAENLYYYLQGSRYRLADRTEVRNDSSGDISTWTTGRLKNKIRSLYLESLQPEAMMKKTPLDSFEVIILKGNVSQLRPALYDLLAHRALDYFETDDPEQFGEDAYFTNKIVFAPADSFMKHSFIEDALSSRLTALKLFQDLLQFHAPDAGPDAEIDADISRIAFAYRYAVMEEKDSLYLAALQGITNRFQENPAAAKAWYLQAAFYSEKAAGYNPLADTTNRYEYLKAVAICKKLLYQKDSSEGKTNCQVLLNNIVRPQFQIETEKVNLPGIPFRTLVTYKQTSRIYFRIIPVSTAAVDALGNSSWDPGFWKKLVAMPALRKFEQKFPETGDYQQHKAEIRVNGLPAGQYALLASNDASFGVKSLMAMQYFFCSSIAFVSHGSDYFVLDRNSGEPLTGVSVQFSENTYSVDQRRDIFKKTGSCTTDAHGFFRIPDSKNGYDYDNRLEFFYGKDYLLVSQAEVDVYSTGDQPASLTEAVYEKRMAKDILFTDRSIYRPGQIVYYKGLLVTRDFHTKKYKMVPGAAAQLYLRDANGQAVDSANLHADDFGSFHGQFKLPENLLNGEFTIQDSGGAGAQSFSVEEYKRPKFYVEYDTIRDVYRIGDSIHVNGSAIAYAGNAIGESKVSYRVVREVGFPYPWIFRFIPAAHEQELAHGEMATNEKGQFRIDFPALPDPSVKKETSPVFTYRIETDITDPNGETHSASTSVAASYQSFQIVCGLPAESRMNRDSISAISVTTKNAAGQFQSRSLTAALYRLKTPDRLIRKRYWDQPDQFVMSKEEFIKAFPFDEYRDETNKASWERLSKVAELTNNTSPDGSFFSGSKKDNPLLMGWYLLELTAKDKDGTVITDRRYIEFSRDDDRKMTCAGFNLISGDEQTAEPGMTREIKTGTTAENVFVVRLKEGLEDSTTGYSFYKLNNEIKSTFLTIGDRDRGGFMVSDVFIKNNRWYASNHLVHVPWTNKELQISYETWRDKLLPGSPEKWKIRISGRQKDQAAAEVLTAMYDASLDQFRSHSWGEPGLHPEYSVTNVWDGSENFSSQTSVDKPLQHSVSDHFFNRYDRLVTLMPGARQPAQTKIRFSMATPNVGFFRKEKGEVLMDKVTPPKILQEEGGRDAIVTDGSKKNLNINPADIQIRKNFNETAFFLPDLKTDSSGEVEISFTMPEALTQWKWMIFAHTRQLAFGYDEKLVVTQKELMVQPNMPRFFREGDSMLLPVKISNLSAEAMSGSVTLDWRSASDDRNQNQALGNSTGGQAFEVGAGQTTVVFFSTHIPAGFSEPLVYRLQARTGKASDGEENIIPVLTRRMLVTETLPLSMSDKDSKQFTWEKLINSRESASLKNQSLTVEYSSDPSWYVVQSLPYLMEFPYECAEQTFNRFYANAVAAQIMNSVPGMRTMAEKWKTTDTTALLSNLQKNQELKTALLRETPWVLDAQGEARQKKNLAALLESSRMSREQSSALDKLKQMQSEGGGFPWFKGGRDNRYITQYIVTGIGHLKKLNAIPARNATALNEMLRSAMAFLDREIVSDYNQRPGQEQENASPLQIQYLYMRSFFPELALSGKALTAASYYRKKVLRQWVGENMYLRGMIALYLNRSQGQKAAKEIIQSLKENATQSDELGMYWKAVQPGYYWQESPVETQSLLIEAFQEISPDLHLTDQMKLWLLGQKRAAHWSNTKSTADACYAVLMSGSNWLAAKQTADISLGDYTIGTKQEAAEAGTGYVKEVIPGEAITSDMGKIRVTIQHAGKENVPSWGAIYWQYFEDLDKISSARSDLSVSKGLYIEKNTKSGPVLEPVSEITVLSPGEKIKVRIIIKNDRDLEYVHLKDTRAACLEPANVLSGYRWQGDLGYYESTADESSSFFFDYLPKGTHVFEYPLFVTSSGTYSDGISTLQCMYAPEFAAHSKAVSIRVKGK